MTHNTPQQLLCQILGISPADLLQANRLLRLPPDERNPTVIDQAARWCFTRVQAVQSSVAPDVAQWMMQTIAQARMAMLQSPPVAAQPPFPPVPPAIPPQQPWQPQPAYPPAAEEPPFVIKKRITRRRSFFDAENLMSLMGVVVILGAGGFFGKFFIENWWDDLQNIGKRNGGNRGAIKDTFRGSTPPPAVPQGGGNQSDDPTPAPLAPPPARAKGNTVKARAFMKDALRAAQMGAFDEADLNAEKALRAAPGYEEADAMRLVVAYQRQYTDLATEALKALDGNSTVLLPRYGECPFIEQDDDSVMFRVKGKNKKFTINELNGMPGVRFRITEKYLDNAATPANDLILGAWHYVMGQTSDGKKDDEGSKGAARQRWQKAVANGNNDINEQGTLMMKLLMVEQAD
jgi:hypothetical protein